MMSENVMIPLSLLNQTVDLLESIDISTLEYPIPCLYEIVYSDFLKKKQNLEPSCIHADVIFAGDDAEYLNIWLW